VSDEPTHCRHWHNSKLSCCQCGEEPGGSSWCPDAAIGRAMAKSRPADFVPRKLKPRSAP
jgi:hypothetical protein